ncbi:MAG: hypothetical protein WD068_03375 [Candidatus Babeliales bacterium]
MRNNFFTHTKQEGSVIVLVTIMMGALTLFALSVWRNTVFLHDLVLKKQEHEMQMRSTEAALNIGIAICKKYPHRFFSAQDDVTDSVYTIQLPAWLEQKNQTALIQLYPDAKSVLIRVLLRKDTQEICGLRCTLERIEKQSIEGEQPQDAAVKKDQQPSESILLEVKNWGFDTRGA